MNTLGIILFIVTSHSELGSTGKPTGVWLEEVTTPYYALVDAGYTVVVASPKGGAMPIDPRSLDDRGKVPSVDRYLADEVTQAIFAKTLRLDNQMARDYEGVFFPGGHGPMFDLASHPEVARVLYYFVEQAKPIAAVCHGPAALLSAKKDGKWLFAGKRVTGFTNAEEDAVQLTPHMPFLLETELAKRGGIFLAKPNFEAHTVVDGLLVTGQNPASAEGTAHAFIKLLKQ